MIKKLLAVVAAAFLLGACDEPAPQAATPPGDIEPLLMPK